MVDALRTRAAQGYRDRFPKLDPPAPGYCERPDPGRGRRTWVVFNGKTMGIFRHWVEAGWQVSGFKGAYHRRYPNLKAAQLAWDRACWAGHVGPPAEWGVGRASEVTPREPLTRPGGRRRQSHPGSAVPPVRAGQRDDLVPQTLPRLYAFRFPPSPLSGNEIWYVVIMGARPGVYAGWSATIQALGSRGSRLWTRRASEGEAIVEYVAQFRAGNVVQYTTRAL